MQLKDIQSVTLLPDFALKCEFIQQAFDNIIRGDCGRLISIDAPLTLEAIEALTDEELQAYFADFGVAEYYPELSREIRNSMLYNMAKLWRFMGTPKAVETLCQYIFDDLDLHLQIKDNLAFDESGHLISPTLHDLFDVTLKPSSNTLPADAITRLYDNICRFARNSQALRNITIEEPDNDYDLPVLATTPYDGLMAVSWVENDTICEEVTPPVPPVVETPDYYILDETTGAVLHSVNSPLSNAKPSAVTITGNIEHIDNPPVPPTPQDEILLGLFYQNDSWQSKPFSANDYWYSGVVNSSDVDYLRSIGLGLTTVSGTYGPNGCIYYQTGYSFELIGLYSDLGETPVTYDPANFYISYRNIGNENIFTINNYSAFSTPVKTYKVRITKNS